MVQRGLEIGFPVRVARHGLHSRQRLHFVLSTRQLIVFVGGPQSLREDAAFSLSLQTLVHFLINLAVLGRCILWYDPLRGLHILLLLDVLSIKGR